MIYHSVEIFLELHLAKKKVCQNFQTVGLKAIKFILLSFWHLLNFMHLEVHSGDKISGAEVFFHMGS
jgi:hypothetical protein